MEYSPSSHDISSEESATRPRISSRESVLLIVLFVLILGAVSVYSVRIFMQQNSPDNKKPVNITSPLPEPDLYGNKGNQNMVLRDSQAFLDAQNTMKQFNDVEELENFLVESGHSGRQYASRTTAMFAEDVAMTDSFMPMAKNESAAAPTSGLGGSSENPDYSKTNIQVQGVDEPDIVKTDGEHIYTLSRSDRSVSLIKAQGDRDMEVLGKIELKGYGQNLFIHNDRLIVFGSDDRFYAEPLYRSFIRGGSYTFLQVYDIKDRSKPFLLRDLKFEGSYFDARLINDEIYFVANTYGFTYFEDEPLLPRILDGGKLIETSDTSPTYYFDIPYDNYSVTTVASFNVLDSNSTLQHKRFMLNGTENMYVAPDHMYLAYTKYLDEQIVQLDAKRQLVYSRLPQRDKQRISEIEAVPAYILGYRDKMYKIDQVYERYLFTLADSEIKEVRKRLETFVADFYKNNIDDIEKTVVHKIAIGNGRLDLVASGSAPGHIINQFSMDQYGETFRIATTRGQVFPWFLRRDDVFGEIETTNNVYTLDKDMNILGRLEGIAPGERIYSTRFMGDRMYMVTFEQVDPFFVIDTSDAANPRILGELKLPGFSEYLHPYNENLIIGFGRDTEVDKDGRVLQNGLKLTLFDATQVNNPIEVESVVLGGRGSSSQALSDHKAFLFSRDKNLLVIPATLRKVSPDGIWGDIEFQGAMVFDVNEEGFTLRGRVEHQNDEIAQKIAPGSNTSLIAPREPRWAQRSIERSLYIDSILYTVSDGAIQANNLDDLEFVTYLQLFDPTQERPDLIPEPYEVEPQILR